METAAKFRNKIPKVHQPTFVSGLKATANPIPDIVLTQKKSIMKTEAKNSVNGAADKNTKNAEVKQEKELLQDKPNQNLEFELPKKEGEHKGVPKLALSLEETIKLVEQLNKKKNQRDKLVQTIENLESFDIDQKEEADETGQVYSRCELTIEDDKGKTFSTKNAVIIATVVEHVNRLCINKLAEIEAEITLP